MYYVCNIFFFLIQHLFKLIILKYEAEYFSEIWIYHIILKSMLLLRTIQPYKCELE